MTKHRQLVYGQPVPQSFLDALQEFIGTMGSPNLDLTMVPGSQNQIQIVAGTGSAQVGLAIDGLWRYISVTAGPVVVPAGAGTYDVFVTTGNNSFATNPSPPPPETDSTDYTFTLATPLLQGNVPGTAHYRKVGEAVSDGTRVTSLRQTIDVDGATVHQPGDVKMSAAAVPAAGWLLCNGQAVSRTNFSALYAALGGTTSPWGQGDGSSTFNVPDLRGRAPIGAGQGAYSGASNRALGASGDLESTLLTWDQSGTNGNGATGSENATHTHGGTTAGATARHTHIGGTGGGFINALNAGGGMTGKIYGYGSNYGSDYSGATATDSPDHAHTFGTGGQSVNHQHALVARNADTAHTNMQPWTAVGYWIKT